MDIVSFKSSVNDLLRKITENMESVFHPVGESYGLTMLQMHILSAVWKESGHTVGSLGKSMHVAGANISAMCKRLEQMGFLERLRDTQDERVVHIELTDKGRAVMREIDRLLKERYSSVLTQQPETALCEIIDGLEQLNQLLTELKNQNKKV